MITELMTAKQAAAYLGVCAHTLAKYHKNGVNGRRLRVAAVRGRQRFFAAADIDDFVRGDKPGPGARADNAKAKAYLRSNGYKV